jgi:hypothetical protein
VASKGQLRRPRTKPRAWGVDAPPLRAADCVAEAVADVDFDPVSAVCVEWVTAVVGRIVVDFRPTPPGPNDTDGCPEPMLVVT